MQYAGPIDGRRLSDCWILAPLSSLRDRRELSTKRLAYRGRKEPFPTVPYIEGEEDRMSPRGRFTISHRWIKRETTEPHTALRPTILHTTHAPLYARPTYHNPPLRTILLATLQPTTSRSTIPNLLRPPNYALPPLHGPTSQPRTFLTVPRQTLTPTSGGHSVSCLLLWYEGSHPASFLLEPVSSA